MSNASFKERPKGGVGDSFRSWWNAQARPTQWAFGVPFILLIALLPLLNIPLLTTEGTNFGAVMAQFGMYALIAIGLNVVVGQAGLLDLGYVGFYAVGAYTVALLTSPASPWKQTGPDGWLPTEWAWLACLPIAIAITAVSGLILGVMENYGQVLFGTGWRDVVAFVLLILILMFRPTGILGESLGRARV